MNASLLDDIDTLARTLYGEAESGNHDDARAIAAVIMNRVLYGRWGASIAKVCLQPWQFSCWNGNDPNRERILKARGPWFAECRKIAEQAATHRLPDLTKGSTHYYETGIRMPKWAKGHKPVYSVPHKGRTAHVFYNDIDTQPPRNAGQALSQNQPLSASRTMRGQASVLTGASGLGVIEDMRQQLEPYAYWVDWLKYLMIALVVIGVAVTLWARYDDRRKGLR